MAFAPKRESEFPRTENAQASASKIERNGYKNDKGNGRKRPHG